MGRREGTYISVDDVTVLGDVGKFLQVRVHHFERCSQAFGEVDAA